MIEARSENAETRPAGQTTRQGNRPSPFGPARELLPKDHEPMVLPENTPVVDAIERMQDADFSQVPVAGADGTIVGVFSWPSFALRLAELPEQVRNALKLERVPIGEFLSSPVYLAPQEYIDTGSKADWSTREYMLVGAPEALEGVLTATDVLGRLYDFAEVFVLVYETEMEVRGLICDVAPSTEEQEMLVAKLLQNTAASASNRVDGMLRPAVQNDGVRQELVSRIVAVLGADRRAQALEDLTFDQYRQIIADRTNWPRFQTAFFSEREIINADLEAVRNLRNDAMHFRRQVSPRDTHRLRSVRDRLREARKRLARSAANISAEQPV